MAILRRNFEYEDIGGGRIRHTQHLKPHAYQKNGVWTRITNRLGSSGDPALTVGSDELFQFRIRDKLAGQSPIFRFGKGNSSITFTPLGTNNVDGVPSYGGAGWKFPNAWNNADFELVAAGHKLKGNVYLRAGHPQSFAIRVDEHVGFDPTTLMLGGVARVLPPVLIPPDGAVADQIPLKWQIGQQGGKWILGITLPAGDYAGWVLDPTLTLQPGPTDGMDADIDPGVPDTNDGSGTAFYIGDLHSYASLHRVPIKFDLSSLPDDAIISSATLSLYATVDWSLNARTYRVYRLKRAWVEAEVTWNQYSTGNAWQTPGGFGADDCEQTEIGNRNFSSSETLNEFKDFVLTPTTKAGLDLGYGWLVKADTEEDDAYRFASSDNATAADRPKLVIEYTLPPRGFVRAPVAAWCH